MNSIRLSRVSHPRATTWGLALVAVVFLAFGAWAEYCAPIAEHAPTAATQYIADELQSWVATR